MHNYDIEVISRNYSLKVLYEATNYYIEGSFLKIFLQEGIVVLLPSHEINSVTITSKGPYNLNK